MSKVVSLSGVKNGVDEVLSLVSEKEYEAVFLIGLKEGKLHMHRSGYQELERIIGLIELLKIQILEG
jgi:hypothetical protein